MAVQPHFFNAVNNNQIEENADSEISEIERRKAALLVCSKATDVEDARLLMEMLGLMPDQVPASALSNSFGKEFS